VDKCKPLVHGVGVVTTADQYKQKHPASDDVFERLQVGATPGPGGGGRA